MRIIAALIATLVFLLPLAGCAAEPVTPPTTTASTTAGPVTEPPVTTPVTEPPATEPPVTVPIITEPPATEPPVIEPEVSPYAYDPHMVRATTAAYLGDLLPLYHEAIDAILAHEGDEVAITGLSSEGDYDRLRFVLLSVFHPSQRLIRTWANAKDGENPFRYDPDTRTGYLEFLTSAEEAAGWYDRFADTYNVILSNLRAEDDEKTRMAYLFLSAASHMGYGTPEPVFGSVQFYDCVTQMRGQCGSYAMFLEELALYAGIEACVGGSDDHAWTVAMVDGVWYHFDPTWENPLLWMGESFTYFGMSEKTRRETLGANVPLGAKVTSGEEIALFVVPPVGELQPIPAAERDFPTDEKRELYQLAWEISDRRFEKKF